MVLVADVPAGHHQSWTMYEVSLMAFAQMASRYLSRAVTAEATGVCAFFSPRNSPCVQPQSSPQLLPPNAPRLASVSISQSSNTPFAGLLVCCVLVLLLVV